MVGCVGERVVPLGGWTWKRGVMRGDGEGATRVHVAEEEQVPQVGDGEGCSFPVTVRLRSKRCCGSHGIGRNEGGLWGGRWDWKVRIFVDGGGNQ